MQSLLPLLFILLCPLMMIFMMKGMHGGHGRSSGAGADSHAGADGQQPGEDTRRDSVAELVSLRADLEMRIEELDARIEELEHTEEGRTRAVVGA